MRKLLTIDQNVGNHFALLMRGFSVRLNDACTMLTVELSGTAEEVIKILAEALSVNEDELEVMEYFPGVWLVQPAVPIMVEVKE